MNLRFLIFTIVIFGIIIISEYITYASFHTAGIIKSKRAEMILMTLGIIIPLIFIASMFYSYKFYNAINSIINTISSVWLALVFFIFLSSFIVFILIMTNHYFNTAIPVIFISKILLLMAITVTIYGVYNTTKIKKIEYSVNSPDLVKDFNGKKIMLISNVHIGNIIGKKFIKKLVDTINIENPDIVFIAGDLIDGSTFPYKDWLSEFMNINPNIKIFYVEGNHEKYNKQYNLFKSNIPDNIINISDKKVVIGNTNIIGLDFTTGDEEGKVTINRLYDAGYRKTQPSIIIIHDPKNADYLAKEGVSLILSGHTHGGQFFPFTLVVDSIYKDLAYGLNKIKGSISITSSGIGSAVMPIRIGTRPEFVIINIK